MTTHPAEVPRSNRGTSAVRGVLRLQDVSFSYGRGRPRILRHVTWGIRPGERVALLGPNGAGKTTLMKLLAGVLAPTSGVIELGEEAIGRRSLARSVARMPQHVTALPRLTVREQVSYAGWLGGLPGKDAWRQAASAVASVNLTAEARTPSTSLSGGQLRRLGLAETLVRRTPVILLDEPTAGLDPEQRTKFRMVLGAAEATSVIVATHETHDIADLFDRVTVLVDGGVLFDGAPDELMNRTDAQTLEAAYSRLVSGEPG